MDSMKYLSVVGMSSRPAYYSGRGATISDLNSTKLQTIYEGIVKDHGKDAGTAFVDMVEDMPEMNATDFINNLFSLENRNWKYEKGSSRKIGHDIEKDKNGDHDIFGAFGTIAAVMGRGNRDDTETIRGSFLMRHGRNYQSFNPMFNRFQ